MQTLNCFLQRYRADDISRSFGTSSLSECKPLKPVHFVCRWLNLKASAFLTVYCKLSPLLWNRSATPVVAGTWEMCICAKAGKETLDQNEHFSCLNSGKKKKSALNNCKLLKLYLCAVDIMGYFSIFKQRLKKWSLLFTSAPFVMRAVVLFGISQNKGTWSKDMRVSCCLCHQFHM